MKKNKYALNMYVQGIFSVLYMLGFLFLCTVVFFNRFQFETPSDSQQYVLPFMIMATSWLVMCLSDLFDILILKGERSAYRHFIANQILFLLFLGGNSLWSKGAQLFMLNHLIIFGIGIAPFYTFIQHLRSHVVDTSAPYGIHLSKETHRSS